MANRPVCDNSANTQKQSDYIAPSYQQNLEARVPGKDSADKSEPGTEIFLYQWKQNFDIQMVIRCFHILLFYFGCAFDCNCYCMRRSH